MRANVRESRALRWQRAVLAARRAGCAPPRQRAAPVVRRPIARRPNNAPPGNMPRYATISICSQEPSARGTSTAR